MPFDLEWVQSRLPDRQVEWRPVLPSTMTEARRLAASGCPSGTIIGADEQTAGVGRYGRHWHSEPEAGLYVSVILRHAIAGNTLPVITLALGLAASAAIQKVTDLACDLRWPNDVLLHSRKCAGILCELEGSAIIAGIGINVNHSVFPDELAETAASLRLASGRIHSREQLLIELASNIDEFCTMLEKQGREPILAMFSQASSFVRGRRVCVEQGALMFRGITAGLNDSGFLILRDDDGRENVIVAGGVRPCS